MGGRSVRKRNTKGEPKEPSGETGGSSQNRSPTGPPRQTAVPLPPQTLRRTAGDVSTSTLATADAQLPHHPAARTASNIIPTASAIPTPAATGSTRTYSSRSTTITPVTPPVYNRPPGTRQRTTGPSPLGESASVPQNILQSTTTRDESPRQSLSPGQTRVTPSNSGNSLHRQAISGAASVNQGSPGSPFVGSQELAPEAFWEPTRDNLIRLQDHPLPAFKWDAKNQRCVLIDENYDSSLETNVSEPHAEVDLPTNASREESRRIKYYTALMLFLWHTPRFAGFYARLVNPNLPTNRERFIQIITTMKDKFKTEKSHFLWRQAYGFVRKAAEKDLQLLELLDDPNRLQALQSQVLALLNEESFREVFHHARSIIDFRRTKERDGHGIYFIKTIWLNLITFLLRVWASEKRMNLLPEPDQGGQNQYRADFNSRHWLRDSTLRDRVKQRFVAWGLLEELRYANEDSFAKLAQDIVPPSSSARIDVSSARRDLLLPGPPPPPPNGQDRQRSPSNPFGGDAVFDDSPIPFPYTPRRALRPRLDASIFAPLDQIINEIGVESNLAMDADDVDTGDRFERTLPDAQ
ncbi:uncharacterized protein TRIVIDRAFT_65244 [Trichoderma virens Gv29-8]|uniref:Uncharacterized protein n=1 Tax=Hypocrea virens (strain Gv29-8 / FGSC 10586) TaxID=413071 RepID=G9NAR8_HYPVG|nr:uncharacterized protein TRIVIDRAFT_65244 [Trichoderma virens Gv29-8]EHK15929.1 hypothetical protein TRIVIDRAFT_65244 [Trichoderma virens Gv29-8]UKZ56298.1 hypothetical protein TrVGV298_010133 [Trichoderma virens]